MESPDLMKRLVEELTIEEKHLVHLELMIMEQASDLMVDPEQQSVFLSLNQYKFFPGGGLGA